MQKISEQATAQKKSVLWLGHSQNPELDPIIIGFKYQLEQNKNLDVEFQYKKLNQGSELEKADADSLKASIDSFDYIIAVGDNHWNTIKALPLSVKKIGLQLSQASFEEAKRANVKNTFAISKDQSIERVFLILSIINPKYSKTTAFFTMDEKDLRVEYESFSKHYEVPFKAITLSKNVNTYESINSVNDCCKVLFLRGANFSGSLIKQKSVLINAYKRKIITLTNDVDMLKHGAMLALYSQPHEIGRQAAQLLEFTDEDQAIEGFQEPQQFMVEFNHSIRQALGHTAWSTGDLIKAIKQQEIQLNNEQ